jgi:hypothetical protein
MALKTYIMTSDYKAPYVTATGVPHNPSSIRLKKFRKGQIVKGEMKHANNKPSFVLVNGVCVVPIGCLKELVTKEIKVAVDGTKSSAEQVVPNMVQPPKINTNPQVRYMDAALIGGLVGFALVYLAEKQGILQPSEQHNYKLYGAIGGALLGGYYVYRKKTQVNVKRIEKE